MNGVGQIGLVKNDNKRNYFIGLAALAGLPEGRLNIAHEAVDRHADGPGRERIAAPRRGRKRSTQRASSASVRVICPSTNRASTSWWPRASRRSASPSPPTPSL